MREEYEVEDSTKPESAEIETAEIETEENKTENKPASGNKDWRDNVYGNINMSVKTLDIIIGCMIGTIVLILVVGAIKGFM